MGRYDLPDPKCRHSPKVRVSSHVDLAEASRTKDPIASTYSCNRDDCIVDCSEWVKAMTRREQVHVVALPQRGRNAQ